MIGEYEIPRGSKLFFGDTARRKRAIENAAVAVFERRGFEEIATPIFSYHQTRSPETVRFSDEANSAVFLRRDSALEVARLIQKRLGRATEHRKWFYIQPVFRYPTTEIHQIGAEAIGESDLSAAVSVCAEILRGAGFGDATLQIGSIALLNALGKELAIAPETLCRHEIHKLLELDIPWVKRLVELSDLADAPAAIASAPAAIASKLSDLAALADRCEWSAKVLSPLYYADMAYYDDLYFRFLLHGELIAMGGGYDSGEARACGFAIYTDKLIA